MKKNFLETPLTALDKCHDGVGKVARYKLWNKSNFQGNWDFVDRLVVPPGASIGRHKHGNNEEMYIILEGSGLMTLNNETFGVHKGDMLLNPSNGEHGMENNSGEDIDLLIIQVSIDR